MTHDDGNSSNPAHRLNEQTRLYRSATHWSLAMRSFDKIATGRAIVIRAIMMGSLLSGPCPVALPGSDANRIHNATTRFCARLHADSIKTDEHPSDDCRYLEFCLEAYSLDSVLAKRG